MGAFHAYDIRGVYGKDFDRTTAYKVGYFLPELLGAADVLVGRDCRVSSQEIHDALVEGICDAGADVTDIGLSSTPMVYFATANYGYKASVQITASHNPAEYNGMKVSRENALPVGLDTGLGQIKAWIEEDRPTPVAARRGVVRERDIHKDYIDFMLRFKGDYSGLKIAFDLSNGMACLFAHEVFGEEPDYLFDTIDGRFPNHEPNPAEGEPADAELRPAPVPARQRLAAHVEEEVELLHADPEQACPQEMTELMDDDEHGQGQDDLYDFNEYNHRLWLQSCGWSRKCLRV